MSEMLKRVTKAICVGSRSSAACCMECGTIEDKAREAIAAMREPTPAMLQAARDRSAVGADQAKLEIWYAAMIDEALK